MTIRTFLHQPITCLTATMVDWLSKPWLTFQDDAAIDGFCRPQTRSSVSVRFRCCPEPCCHTGQELMGEAGKGQASQHGRSRWGRLWSWDSDAAEEPRLSGPKMTLGESANWTGRFPLRKGGVVVFTLIPTQPFNIAILPSQSAGHQGGPSLPFIPPLPPASNMALPRISTVL